MKKEIELPELTKMSSKGQIVIPKNLRKKLGIKENTVFAISAEKNIVILKKLNRKLSKEDLKTLKSIEEAWRDIEQGKCKTYTKSEFFKELEKW